jgi:SAM-dependent methyltransferase
MMDLSGAWRRSLDLPVRALRKLRGAAPDYRAFLYEDVIARLGGSRPARVLEIGPRDGVDSARLAALADGRLVLVDLPDKESWVRSWLPSLDPAKVELFIGNIMYDTALDAQEPFDLVWCTGVLYHNPEQLRMVRRLYDFTRPGGLLAIETATARRAATRDENCVEIWYPSDKALMNRYHLAGHITHLPSRRAVESWLHMVGFRDIAPSSCHRRVTRALAADRAAFVARRPLEDVSGTYYSSVGLNFGIGRAR